MKKRLLSLAITLALCLGLAVPAMATDASGLDAKSAQAYYNALAAYGKQSGLVAYADLQDMDSDNIPELIVITVDVVDGLDAQTATFDIWQIKNGSAVKSTSIDYSAQKDSYIGYISQNGNVYIDICTYYQNADVFGYFNNFVTTGNFSEEFATYGDFHENTRFFERTINGVSSKITAEEYHQALGAYAGTDFNVFNLVEAAGYTPKQHFLGGEYWKWYLKDNHASSYQTVLNLLSAKAAETPAPAAGTYGAYTITVNNEGVVAFSAAKVEKTTVQVQATSDADEGIYRPFESVEVMLVTVCPGSQITITCTGDFARQGMASGNPGKVLGTNRFSLYYLGAGYEVLFAGSAEKSLSDGKMVSLHWTTGDLPYYIMLGEESAPATPSTPSTSSTVSFADVSASAYYADAVSWAVSKAITNGTSTTAFSPEENCTQAQILTFLWRASGKPTLNLGVLPTWVDEAYQEAVLWAAYKNMIDIVTFDPDKPCTRSTAVSYIWQALGRPTPTTSARFSDVNQSAAYAQAVSWAVGAGVTNGTSTTTFSPNDTCTRGQIVTFLHRAMG